MFKQSLKLIIFAGIAMILRYGYRISISRGMGLEAYGRVGVAMTILDVFVLFLLSSIPPTMAKFRAEGGLVLKSAYKFMYLGLGSSVLLLALSPVVMKYMEIPFTYILIISGCILVGTVTAIFRGIMQGTHRTDEFGISQIVTAAGFFGFVLLSLYLGIGEIGAVLALFAGMSLPAFYLYPKVKLEKSDGDHFGKMWRYLVPISATRIIDAFVLNIDLLMLKIWYPATVIGMYSIAGPIAGLPMVAFSSIATVLLPKVSASKKDGRMLTKKAAQISVVIILGVLVLILLPKFFIKILFNPQLTELEWAQTVATLRIMAFSTVFIGIYKLVAASLQGMGMAKELCYFTVMVLAVEILIGAAVIPEYGMLGAAGTTLVASGVAVTGALALLRRSEIHKRH
ncbi:MAG: oligosaccharide flippase family protein [archaeon]